MPSASPLSFELRILFFFAKNTQWQFFDHCAKMNNKSQELSESQEHECSRRIWGQQIWDFRHFIFTAKWCILFCLNILVHIAKFHLKIWIITDIAYAIQEDSIIWLRENDESEEEILKLWIKTFSKRDVCRSVATYFATFKCLRAPFGYKLVFYSCLYNNFL